MADNTEHGILVNREQQRLSNDIVNAPAVVGTAQKGSGRATNLNTDPSSCFLGLP
jgi:hypothetical protein